MSVSETQNRILKTLFVYRYLTNAYLSKYLAVSSRTMQRNTQNLEELGYLGYAVLDKFNKTKYYFVTTKGLKYLKKHYSSLFSDQAFARLRRARPTQTLIEKSMRIAEFALRLKQGGSQRAIFSELFLYGDSTQDIAVFKPHLFVVSEDGLDLYFFLHQSSPDYVNYRLVYKIYKQSIDALEGGYGDVRFVLVTDSNALQARLIKKTRYIEDKSLNVRTVLLESF